MENHIFQRAKNMEEYLAFAARLILHFQEKGTYIFYLVNFKQITLLKMER